MFKALKAMDNTNGNYLQKVVMAKYSCTLGWYISSVDSHDGMYQPINRTRVEKDKSRKKQCHIIQQNIIKYFSSNKKQSKLKSSNISYNLSTHYKYTFHMLTDGFEKPLGLDRVHRRTTQICLHINIFYILIYI